MIAIDDFIFYTAVSYGLGRMIFAGPLASWLADYLDREYAAKLQRRNADLLRCKKGVENVTIETDDGPKPKNRNIPHEERQAACERARVPIHGVYAATYFAKLLTCVFCQSFASFVGFNAVTQQIVPPVEVFFVGIAVASVCALIPTETVRVQPIVVGECTWCKRNR